MLFAALFFVATQAAPPPQRTCAIFVYDARDGCDCGCGAPDPDCPEDANVADCFLNNCNLIGAVDPDLQVPDPSDLARCVEPACGDGVTVFGEACDDGNVVERDGCEPGCALVTDGFVCSGPGQLAGQGCWQTVCGDGRRDVFGSAGRAGEFCDDGNTENGDGCSADCANIEVGSACRINNTVCGRIVCGDGRADFDGGEACDDGNADSGDGCSNLCLVEAGFDCDWFSSTYRPSSCARIVCGDELIEGAEACDDGNTNDDDGCDAACQREDGFVCDTDRGQVGPAQVGPDDLAGPSACRAVECGDGVFDSSEVCEDGNDRPGDGCDQRCFIENGWGCSLGDDARSVCTFVLGEGEGETGEGEGEGEPVTPSPDIITRDDCDCSSTSSMGLGTVAVLALLRRRRR